MARFIPSLRCLTALTLCLLLIPQVFADSLSPKVEQTLQKNKLPQSALSLTLIPLTGGGKPVYFNADTPVNPASTMKLVTTYSALELLGPTFQWQTDFYVDGPIKNGVLNGNLYLKGGGDPKLNMEKLWLLMRDLRNNGIKTVNGDLVLDRSHFLQLQSSRFNDDGGDDSRPYLVPPDSLLVNLKAVRFIIRTEQGKAVVVMEPPIASVQLSNQIKVINPTDKCPAWPDIAFHPQKDATGATTAVNITGRIPNGCSAQTYMSLLDHSQYAAGVVRSIMTELGGSIRGIDRVASVPPKATLVARAMSPDLVEIIRDINKFSNNTMAKQLFLTIGRKYRTRSDVDDAIAAQRTISEWMGRKGIDPSRLTLENGSGLSRNERLSTREMGQMLATAWKGPYAAEFIASLPLVGMDGTMRKRLKRTAMTGQAHIKTGTLNNVRAIGGFTRDRNGNLWAVAAILNHPRPWGASSILDQILLDLYNNPPK